MEDKDLDAAARLRFEPIILPLWEPDSETATLLMSFAASLPLRGSSPDLLRSDIIGAIVTRTGGTIGEMLALLRAAAIVAVETEGANSRAGEFVIERAFVD